MVIVHPRAPSGAAALRAAGAFPPRPRGPASRGAQVGGGRFGGGEARRGGGRSLCAEGRRWLRCCRGGVCVLVGGSAPLSAGRRAAALPPRPARSCATVVASAWGGGGGVCLPPGTGTRTRTHTHTDPRACTPCARSHALVCASSRRNGVKNGSRAPECGSPRWSGAVFHVM